MEGGVTKAAGGYAISGGGGGRSRSESGGDSWTLENPFSFKVLQVFTGVGVGCGIGVGVGRPIYLARWDVVAEHDDELMTVIGKRICKPEMHLGWLSLYLQTNVIASSCSPFKACAIPAFQQVLTATRGAMDVFSGAGRHVNSNLRRFGVKHLEAGIGCGVGIGHGFGVGIALKPGVIQKIQISIGQAVAKLMTNFGTMPGTSTLQSGMADSVDSSVDMLNKGYGRNAGPSVGNILQLTTKPVGITASGEESSRSPSVVSSLGSQALNAPSSGMPVSTHTEKVINSFLQNPIFKDDEEGEVDKLVGRLRSENNILQMVLKHQKVIDELIEENEKLRQILVEEFKISPAKLRTSNVSRSKMSDPCSDCIECRRKRRAAR
ncbi:hypothetical protein Taro_007633 [Colocasia esculenta]|uniref:Uncharacterized protein n=1 Tax=Colocasia esculenta TaxID=4460 RepID=A0A843TVI2_COLES|nr:hypothetical protein [Colocasia esculenta]